MSSPQTLQRLNRFISAFHKLTPQGFGVILGRVGNPSSTFPGSIVDRGFDAKKMSYEALYVVPHNLCVPIKSSSTPPTPQSTLPLSAMLAIFDDITTWPLFAIDPLKRGGVSLTLSAEYPSPHIPIHPNTSIIIRTKVMKLGQTFAFIEATAVNEESGRIVAIGRHTKYLPMGAVYELAFKYFSELVFFFADNFGKQGVINDKNYEKMMPILDVCKVEDIAVIEKEDDTNSSLAMSGTFKVGTMSKNPMGSLHGGCSAVLCEVLSEEIMKKSDEKSGKNQIMDLRSISMTYASTGKGEVNVEGVLVTDLSKAGGMSTRVQIKRQSGGELVSEAFLNFERREEE